MEQLLGDALSKNKDFYSFITLIYFYFVCVHVDFILSVYLVFAFQNIEAESN